MMLAMLAVMSAYGAFEVRLAIKLIFFTSILVPRPVFVGSYTSVLVFFLRSLPYFCAFYLVLIRRPILFFALNLCVFILWDNSIFILSVKSLDNPENLLYNSGWYKYFSACVVILTYNRALIYEQF